MWETAFDESMLNTHENLIIHCPYEELAEDLMKILERNGVTWCDEEKPTVDTEWDECERNTCYWVESKKLSYGDKRYAEDDHYGEESKEHIRCTFYGVDTPDFDVASDDELWILLGI